eukprot:3874909-Lingulodinium_polyedra.AAC.1
MLSAKQVACMKLLGSMLSYDGSSSRAVGYRLAQGTKAFFVEFGGPLAAKAPLGAMLARFSQRVVPV